jgi:hypothetical protein
VTASRTTLRRSDQPRSKPEWIQQDTHAVRVYGTCTKVKSVSQLRMVFPEPAKATTTRDRVGSRATKPLISAVVVSFLPAIRKCWIGENVGLTSRRIRREM